MIIFINDKKQAVKAKNVYQLLQEIGVEQEGMALAVNEEVITKHNWKKTALKENDKILIFTATAGG